MTRRKRQHLTQVRRNLALMKNDKPEIWSFMNIISVPKSGDLSITDNYRGIKKESAHKDRASYLDLCIEVQNKHFHTKMYDKCDSFNFDIVNYPFVQDSNIPENPSYGVYSSKLISIACAYDTYIDFKNRHDSLCLKLMRQGFCHKKLVKQLGKSKLKHKDILT